MGNRLQTSESKTCQCRVDYFGTYRIYKLQMSLEQNLLKLNKKNYIYWCTAMMTDK